MPYVIVATCNLAQWALDFVGNLHRIKQSIIIAKQKGARYRLGPELEITGYGCEDHFTEPDTYLHAWECLADIIKSGVTDDILCDIGMPVMHKNVYYNCRVYILNGKILLIRPKMSLAADGNYRENRYFQAWQHRLQTEEYFLPRMIREITGQDTVAFGDAAIATRDTAVSSETCEELFTPNCPNIALGLNGIEIIGNGSGSHHQLRKLHKRISLIQSATEKNGGIYLYANQQGCDGGRLYFDGCCMIFINGQLVAQGSQFSLASEVEVITATVNLEEVRSYRGASMSRGVQASESKIVQRIVVDWDLTIKLPTTKPSEPITTRYYSAEEEICYGPACWLWDYLRRSNLTGFFLPLSGGADSSAVAAIVGAMCQLLVKEVKAKNEYVIRELKRVLGEDKVPIDPKALANRFLYTTYMGTTNSSKETRQRAKDLADQIGCYHLDVNIDSITNAFMMLMSATVKKTPKFKVHGGTPLENIALQNIQARSRMVLAYFLAQLLPWSRGFKGTLLVLGTANVDEALRGYYTKYDCSSADVNPIGSIAKNDLKMFLSWAADHLNMPVLTDVVGASPTAELEPTTEQYTQSDEADMGMSYKELSIYGRLRKIFFCGPVSMFEKLYHEWDHLSPNEIADKVKRFFYYYSINRHKMTTLTPSYHAEGYSPDDNRYDLRPFLYPSSWQWQFQKIDERVQLMNKLRAREADRPPAAPADPASSGPSMTLDSHTHNAAISGPMANTLTAHHQEHHQEHHALNQEGGALDRPSPLSKV